MLGAHGLLDHGLHLAEMMARQGAYAGWTDERVHSLMRDAVDALTALTPEVRSCVCSLDMRGYFRAKKEDPSLIDEYKICVEVTFHRAFVERGEEMLDKAITLYFDRNEPFMRRISKIWERRKRHPGWSRQLADITSVSRHDHFGIQAADMLAWIGRRQQSHADVEVYQMAVSLSALCKFEYIDYERLIANRKFFRRTG
jgi:hypothetical protein